MKKDNDFCLDDFWHQNAHLEALATIWNQNLRSDGLTPLKTWDREDARSYLQKWKDQKPEPYCVSLGKVNLFRQSSPHWPPTVSYSFPIDLEEIRESDRPLVTTWFSRFLGRSPVEIKSILRNDWSTFGGVVRNFADLVLDYTPCAIVSDSDELWISFQSEEHSSCYITFPEPASLTDDELAIIHEFDVPTLESFCRHFREVSLAPCASIPILRFRSEPVTLDDLCDCGDFLVGGLSVFQMPNGDQMILAKDGKVWKWAHELLYREPDQGVTEGFSDFGTFVLTFIDFLTGRGDAWKAFEFY